MDYNTLVANLQAMGVTPPDVLRASIYYQSLVDAQTFFNVTLAGPAPGGLAGNYNFVQNAVQSASLLNELAVILDTYIAPAVQADLQDQYNNHGHGGAAGWTYRDYFDNMILDAVPANYALNVANFFGRYPMTDHAKTQLQQNFLNNIQLCCQRVINDRVDLVTFYDDLYGDNFQILRLTRIKSSGSDFHKGGKQVLILHFAISYTQAGVVTRNKTLKVVYKPGDLEADCLIAGDSAAVNAVTPGFMANSLFEIYNARLAIVKAANPAFTGLPLDTYRILPRTYNSQHGAGAPLPIQQSYGYLQYLNYDMVWDTINFWGYYPFASSDFFIFRTQDADEIISAFYRKAGAFAALASTFSVVDMHFENFRVSDYKPFAIDMEISLTSQVNDIANTSLIAPNIGAFNTENFGAQNFHWVVDDINTPGGAYIDREYENQTEANRLYAWAYNGARRLVPINNFYLLQGYNDGMQVLQAAQVALDFDPWFVRLNNNVVVRYLPFPTSTFKQVVTQAYIERVMGNPPGQAYPATLDRVIIEQLTIAYEAYVNGNPPNFLAFVNGECGPDYQNLDIPVFYYRINAGNVEIVNSRGVVVNIPANVTTLQGGPPPVPTPAPCQPPRVGRATFFAADPTANVVRAPQVTVLGGAGFAARSALIQASILAALGIAAVPANPGVLIPQAP